MTSISNSHGPTMLVGRDEELSLLDELLSTVKAGCGKSALIVGEAGIGKTALLGALAERCERAGSHVLRDTAEQPEQHVPFQAVRGALRAARSVTAEGATATGQGLSQEAGMQEHGFAVAVADEFLELLGGLCCDGPVALLVDDLQWADPLSLEVLHRIQRDTAGRLPLLLCAAVRTNGASIGPAPALRAIEASTTQRLPLHPLAEDGVSALIVNLLGAPPGPELLRRATTAAGNPLFVTELVSALSLQGGVCITEGVADVDAGARDGGGTLPLGVKEPLLCQMDLLSHQARDVLEAIAVMGSHVYLSDLATVLGVPVMKVWQLVREAVGMGLLSDEDSELTFHHSLLREALLTTIPRTVRVALQEQAGRALAAADAPPEQVAQYLLLSDTALGADVLDWLARAIHPLAARAPSEAARLLDRALAETRREDPRWATFSLELTRVLLRTRQAVRAEQVARTALAVAGDPAAQLELRRLIAFSLSLQDDHERALDTVTEALNIWPDDARCHAFAAQCHFVLTQFPEAERKAQEAVAAGERGDLYGTVHGLTALALVRLCELRSCEALELSDRAMQLLGRQPIASELPIAPHFTRGLALMDLDRYTEAEISFAQGLTGCEDGDETFLAAFHFGRTRLLFNTGRWDDALAEISAGMDTAEHPRLESALCSQAAVIAVHRGEAGNCGMLDTSVNDSRCDFLCAYARLPQALMQEAVGDQEGALAALCEACETAVTGVGPRALQYLCPDAARLAAELNDASRLRQLNRVVADSSTGSRTASGRAVELFCRGLMKQDCATLQHSADLFRSTGRVLYEAYALERMALLLAMGERRDEARKALNAALGLYDQLGATWDVTRAERQLATVGLRLRRRARGAVQTEWEALTEAERVVVGHVATGCSNQEIAARLFLSPRTVQFHLTSIFSKLGITSRVELAVQAVRQGDMSRLCVDEQAITN
jgi:DNA-binding CsgD family transcriptional regulator